MSSFIGKTLKFVLMSITEVTEMKPQGDKPTPVGFFFQNITIFRNSYISLREFFLWIKMKWYLKADIN